MVFGTMQVSINDFDNSVKAMIVKIMKIVVLAVWIALLCYAIYLMSCLTLFALLSCSPDTNMEILVYEHIIPNAVGVIAMLICLHASYKRFVRLLFNKEKR